MIISLKARIAKKSNLKFVIFTLRLKAHRVKRADAEMCSQTIKLIK